MVFLVRWYLYAFYNAEVLRVFNVCSDIFFKNSEVLRVFVSVLVIFKR